MAACGKVRFSSKKEAKKNLKRIKRETDHTVKTIYYCDDCSSYHLTSQSKTKNKFLSKLLKPKT